MKNKESIALQMLKNKGREINKEQLLHFIFGPGKDTYNRFRHFLEVQHLLKGWQFWYLFRQAYENSDGLFIYRQKIKELLQKNEPEKEFLMEPEELEFLTSLDPIEAIYRGMSKLEKESGDIGVSWTLSRQHAEFFAFEYHRAPFPPDRMTVMTLNVNASDIIAYFGDSEEEVIYIHNKQE